jgi:NAD(P)H-dependent flavin oxidoreductase YrpB (nitropropane dioxygenase family)
VAANLLVPFARDAHVQACEDAGVAVVTVFAGFAPDLVARLRARRIDVWHQVGTREVARRALADGANGLIAQGIEAGGHLLGVTSTPTALVDVLAEADGRVPVLAAGGADDEASARALRDAGAVATASGTRFLLTHESGAHPAYKEACLAGSETVDTMLFALGWPMRHRVLVNAVVRRWREVPAGVRRLNARTSRLGRLLPLSAMALFPRLQLTGIPLLSPGPPVEGMPARTVRVSPLYAGVGVKDMDALMSAGDVVRLLAGVGAQRAARNVSS